MTPNSSAVVTKMAQKFSYLHLIYYSIWVVSVKYIELNYLEEMDLNPEFCIYRTT
jgi:hypothetical protein